MVNITAVIKCKNHKKIATSKWRNCYQPIILVQLQSSEANILYLKLVKVVSLYSVKFKNDLSLELRHKVRLFKFEL